MRERLPDGSSRPKPVIFAQLGPEADADAKTARDMPDALDRYIRKRFGDNVADAETLTEVGAQAPALRMLALRAFGMRVVVEKVYKDLGLERALKRIAKKHEVDFDFERIVFAMLLNRMVDPVSKRACNEWVRNEAWMPELPDGCTHGRHPRGGP